VADALKQWDDVSHRLCCSVISGSSVPKGIANPQVALASQLLDSSNKASSVLITIHPIHLLHMHTGKHYSLRNRSVLEQRVKQAPHRAYDTHATQQAVNKAASLQHRATM
jgi:hypothetical protein